MPGRHAYNQLVDEFDQTGRLLERARIAQWDYLIADGFVSRNWSGLKLLVRTLRRHERLQSDEIADLLARAEQHRHQLNFEEGRNLDLMRREHVHAKAVPTELVKDLTFARGACEGAWREAKQADDWSLVRDEFATLLGLVREVADRKAQALGCSPVDALLDQELPGINDARTEEIFREIEAFLPPMIGQVIAKQAGEPAPVWLNGPFPKEAQMRIVQAYMRSAGYDFARGGLNTTPHPTTTYIPDNARISSTWDEDFFRYGVWSGIHETGHALYDQGLPVALRRQPAGAPRFAIHETQSLLHEFQLGKSRPFMEWFAPTLAREFGTAGPEWSADNLHRMLTRVERSMIRGDADEVTYLMHTIQRWRTEKLLFARTSSGAWGVKPDELPDIFDDQMQMLLGVRPASMREGVLQDIHWYGGMFGFFPSYSWGATGAAQFMEQARKDLPGLDADIRAGHFAPLVTWQRQHIHSHGSIYTPDEIFARVTGRKLDTGAMKRHIQRRYLGQNPPVPGLRPTQSLPRPHLPAPPPHP